MSVRAANCPSCGAPIEFANSASVMVVCASCGTASVRRDADLEKLGRVGEVAPIESAVSLGASGKWEGRHWTAIGLVQLDHGKGPWNEWCIAFDDGSIGWLAEAQGEVIVTFPRPDIETPPDQPLGVGSKVALGEATYVVAESGTARITAASGELPEEIRPGETYQYFDLRGHDHAFATVALHADGSGETYVGSVVQRPTLGVNESTVQRAGPRRVAPDRVQCPHCGAPIQIRDPANARRVVCSACGTMTDPRRRELEVIEKAARLSVHPAIAIGTKARLREQDFEVLAFLVRSVRVDGIRYPWQEYLLRRADGEYRWLVCADGHWNLTEPAELADVTRGRMVAHWKGATFRHFQGGTAVVDHVQGELYWEVSIGETVEVADYVAPPLMLSFEKTSAEMVASVARYVPQAEMAAAFPAVVHWPPIRGVGPNQPNPWIDARRRTWAVGGVLAALVGFLMIFFAAADAHRDVVRLEGASPVAAPAPAVAAPAPAVAAPADEDRGIVFSDEFRLEPSVANVRIHLAANPSNQWLGVDGALVNLDTGAVDAFALEAERWSGVEDGESWSEGSNESTVYLGSIPAGRYALRVDASGTSQGGADSAVPYTLTVTSQVPSFGRGFALIALILAVPSFVSMLGARFETTRWSTSDHAPGGSE